MENYNYSTLPKSGTFKASTIGKIAINDDDPKTRFDINTNVDYEENIITESIDILCEYQGVAYLYFKWQIKAIKDFFKSLWFPDDCIIIDDGGWYWSVRWNYKYKRPNKDLLEYLIATLVDFNTKEYDLSEAS